MRTVNDLLADFDDVIEKRAAEAQQTRTPAQDADAVVKLAERLARSEAVKTASAGIGDDAALLTQVARSLALTDTLLNMPTLAKIAAVEKRARDAGATDAQVESFFEKNAASFPMVSVLQQMTWLF